MPRYFFNVLHHAAEPDTEGSEFSDDHAARTAALRLCGELIAEMDGEFWSAPVWRLQVRNHDDRLLFTFAFSAEAPAGRG